VNVNVWPEVTTSVEPHSGVGAKKLTLQGGAVGGVEEVRVRTAARTRAEDMVWGVSRKCGCERVERENRTLGAAMAKPTPGFPGEH
jgi:hypothetical protein